MAKKVIDKRTWANIGAGVVATIAIVFGVAQCSENENRADTLRNANATIARSNAVMDSLARANDALRNDNRDLNIKNAAQADTIIVLRDSIGVLNDSLNVTREKLEKCCKNTKKPVAKKPAAQSVKKPAVVAARTVTPVDTANVVARGDAGVVSANKTNGDVRVEIENGDNNTVNVNNGTIINYNGVMPEKKAKTITVDIYVERTRTYYR